MLCACRNNAMTEHSVMNVGILVFDEVELPGIDASLNLVPRPHSRDLAVRTARQVDFDWRAAA